MNGRFEVLTVVLMKIQIFSDVKLHCGVSSYCHFHAAECLHLTHQAFKDGDNMVTEMSRASCWTVQCHFPEYVTV